MSFQVSGARLELPVIEDGARRGTEVVDALEVERGVYRARFSPGLVEGLAAADEFVVTDDLAGFKVVRHSGYVAAWVFAADDIQRRRIIAALEEPITTAEGRLDGGLQSVLVYTVPIALGFPRIQEMFDGATRGAPGSTWMFANVYGPDDRPLGWWDDLIVPEPGRQEWELLRTEARAQLQAVQDQHRGAQYAWNLERGSVRYDPGDGPKTGRLQVAGSLAAGTWRWAWARNDLPIHVTELLSRVREFGAQHSIARLVRPEWAAMSDDALTVVAVANRIISGQGAFSEEVGDARIYYLIAP